MKMQAFHWTGLYAFSTADAFRGTGNLQKGKAYGTGFLAGQAGNAAVLLPVNLYQAKAVKPAINSAQRTEVLAERTVDFYREKQKQGQDPKLPEEQTSCLTAKQGVSCKQRQGPKECSGGAQIFAEGRNLCKASE